jgi:hypothetical protein
MVIDWAFGGVVKHLVVGCSVLAIAAFAAAPVEATALLRLTPQGVSPADYAGPTDPALITADGFRLTYHGGGQDDLVNPVMLIIGIPDLSLTAPTLTVSTTSGFDSVSTDLGDTQNRYGGTWNTTTGFAGTYSSSASGSVYDYIGFSPSGSASENYPNWSDASGLTSWNLFVYAITFDPHMEHGDYVEFDTSLPVGTFVVGYGCESLNRIGNACGGQGDTESTPFTFAGMVPTTSVPEPATLLLLMPGMAAAFAARRRRARS